MLIKNSVIRILSIAFFLLHFFSDAQIFDYSYIKEYYRLQSKNKDSTEFFCNNLIYKGNTEEISFGLAGKAYINTLRSKYNVADSLFELSKLRLDNNNLKRNIEVKGNINYLNALRYVETHEFELAINILNKTINFCGEECSTMLNIRLLSTLGRVYSMSKNPLRAIEIGRESLNEIKNTSDFSNSLILKKEYLKTLVTIGNRHLNFFILDNVLHKTYLDSTKKYTELSKNFSKKYNIQDYDSYIYSSIADIAFYKEKYKKANEYYNKSLNIYKDKKYKKKVEQVLFCIAESHYFLNEIKEAKAIFLNQLKNDVWSEYQLLNNEALCYYYLFKINEQENNLNIALDYAEKYVRKNEDFLNAKSASDLSVNDKMHLRERENESQNYIKNYKLQVNKNRTYQHLLLILIIISILFLIYFIRFKRIHLRNINNLNLRINELQKNVLYEDKPSKSSSLTDKGSLGLFQKIKDLEKEELYLKPNYTLTFLAKKLNTNSTYLSETVNKHFGVSFIAYTNRLRIHRIISEIRTNKYLRNYTIEALAKEAGYKSVNSFNINFKKLLKITPSQYLKEIKKGES